MVEAQLLFFVIYVAPKALYRALGVFELKGSGVFKSSTPWPRSRTPFVSNWLILAKYVCCY